MMYGTYRFAIVFAWIVTFCGAGFAQSTPDAGSLLQQIEKNIPRIPSSINLPKTLPTPSELRADDGVMVLVKSFVFSGNHLLDSATLEKVVAPWVGRTLDLNELKKTATAVAEAYRAQGWIVRAYLPQQDVTEGQITIHIVEATFGGIKTEAVSTLRTQPDRALRLIRRQQEVGQPLNGDAIDRGILLAEDLPGVSIKSSLAAGPGEGETSLILAFMDKPLFSSDVTFDNTGSRSTGVTRSVVNTNIGSLFGWNESLNVSLIHSEGSDYGRLAASLPMGDQGVRVGVSASLIYYKLVSSEFAALKNDGSSNTLGLDLSYPWIRSRQSNVYLLANIDNKHLDNRAGDVTLSRYNVPSVSAGIYGNFSDALGGGGSSSVSATFTTGKVQFPEDLPSNLASRNDGSDVRFSKLNYQFTRRQTITNMLSIQGVWSGQLANRNLDSSERFYLGGSGGVRAYPSSEGGGASGNMFNLELSRQLPYNTTLSGFYDMGRVNQYEDNRDASGNSLSGATPNSYRLSGKGLSLLWISPLGASVKASWAHRIGNNPNPARTGNDQDGSLKPNRYWITVSIPL